MLEPGAMLETNKTALVNEHPLKTCNTNSGEELHKTQMLSTAMPFLAKFELVGMISKEAHQMHILTLFGTFDFQIEFQIDEYGDPSEVNEEPSPNETEIL